jgi:PPM family protein phosphatase
MLIFEAAYRSDQGDREKNEDRTLVMEEAGIFALADGMGGERGGEVASQLAVDTVQRAVGAGRLDGVAGEAAFPELGGLFREVNAAILDVCRQMPTLAGMGTTLTLALVGEDSLSFAHVGDSRL